MWFWLWGNCGGSKKKLKIVFWVQILFFCYSLSMLKWGENTRPRHHSSDVFHTRHHGSFIIMTSIVNKKNVSKIYFFLDYLVGRRLVLWIEYCCLFISLLRKKSGSKSTNSLRAFCTGYSGPQSLTLKKNHFKEFWTFLCVVCCCCFLRGKITTPL